MFPEYRKKLKTIIWMGVGAAMLSSLFSTIIISMITKINKNISNQPNK
jgi:hypothetical protein